MKPLFLRWNFLLLGILACVWVTACTSPTTSLNQANSGSVDCRMVEHELGETEICGQPEQVAVLSPHILDVVLALGAQPVPMPKWWLSVWSNSIILLSKFPT